MLSTPEEEANISQGCVLAYQFHYLQYIMRWFASKCCTTLMWVVRMINL